MIRHAGLDLTSAIALLAIAVVETPFGTLLVTPVGAASLAQSCVPPTGEATIPLAPITAGAQEKQRVAFLIAANPRSETIVRHAHPQGGTGQWLRIRGRLEPA